MPIENYPYELEQESVKTAQFQDYVQKMLLLLSVKGSPIFCKHRLLLRLFSDFSFLFLSLKVSTVLSFALAIGLSLVALQFQRTFIKKNSNKTFDESKVFYYSFVLMVLRWLA